ncbi:peptidase A4 family domain-containing protein [Trichoderma velutinum]
MKFSTLTANLLLVASAALASPLSARKQEAMDAIRARRSLRRSNASGSSSNNTNGTADATTPNWAGVAISQQGVTEVSGTFTVPQPKMPPGADPNSAYCGVAWVGIDGWTNVDLIQTGVLWCTYEDNTTFWFAWYEYLPGFITEFDGVNVTAGSVVTVNAKKTGTNSGITTLTVDGVTVSHDFTGENFSLPGTSAEWIVEDYEIGSWSPPYVPFADFGTVTFTEATAVVNGATITPGEGDWVIIDLEGDKGPITSSNFSGSTVTINYVNNNVSNNVNKSDIVLEHDL